MVWMRACGLMLCLLALPSASADLVTVTFDEGGAYIKVNTPLIGQVVDTIPDGAPGPGDIHDNLIVNWFAIKRELMQPPDDPDEIAEKVNDPSWIFQGSDANGEPEADPQRRAGSAVAPATFGTGQQADPALHTPDQEGDASAPRLQTFDPQTGPDGTEGAPMAMHEAATPRSDGILLQAAAPYLMAASIAWMVWHGGRWLFLALFTRFHGDKALENPHRARVLKAVTDKPGLHIRALADELGLSTSTAAHHLRILEQTGHVESRCKGRIRHVFPVGVGRQEKQAAMALRHEKTRAILAFIQCHPGAQQGQVAGGVGVAQSLAHWHLKRLQDAGLVEVHREGRSRVYRPGETATV